MSKKVVLFVAFMVLNLYGTSSATGPISGNKSVPGSSSGSRDMSLSQPGQFSRYAASSSNRTSDIAAKTRSMPTVSERRAEVQNTIKRLITLSQKASSDIRREIKKIKALKDKGINDVDIKAALDIADKFDKYAVLLQKKEKLLTDKDRDIHETLKSITDMSHEYQRQLDEIQLQSELQKRGLQISILNRIVKELHDMRESSIRNLD